MYLSEAAQAAGLAEQQQLNRYRAGQVSFLEVSAAQTTALNARRALAQQQGNRQVASVALIQSLGGGWRSDALRQDAAQFKDNKATK